MRPGVRLLVKSLAVATPVVAGALALLGGERDARADYYIVRRPQSSVSLDLGLDLEGAVNVTPPANTSVEGGGGFKLRVGVEVHRPYFRVTPEGGFAYTHLFDTGSPDGGTGSSTSDSSWDMERIFVGVRLGFGEFVVPSVYGHVGFGWRVQSGTGSSSTAGTVGGLAADGGVALDFHVLPHLTLGLHAEYVTVQTTPEVPDWVAFGGHADFRF